MKKHLFTTLAVFGATVLAFFASTTAASACVWGVYQPTEPKLLREK
ncbi:cyclic lactone autoinducer peptide [Anaerosolibacter carboniphilus]|uniref:Cyclic lactone autoinducer peptide n=1 Tax=Anaerosolibacter carboniphilus TaxID=1417629 RepID=A0A841KPY4_9FIRM|nr:cyclic lactone autoinducer peptide [Anaerosolibacter carboniphilus]MBB6215497.1 cyclic lactone autoinducer peptide [Anaerosolibacter carboniphilus]